MATHPITPGEAVTELEQAIARLVVVIPWTATAPDPDFPVWRHLERTTIWATRVEEFGYRTRWEDRAWVLEIGIEMESGRIALRLSDWRDGEVIKAGPEAERNPLEQERLRWRTPLGLAMAQERLGQVMTRLPEVLTELVL